MYSAWNAKDNRNYKLSGIRVNEENGMAGIFAQTSVAITIQNLDVENGSFTSKSDKAGGLIAYGENTVTFNSVNFTGDLIVKGQNIAGGFVAQPKGYLTVTNSSINNASIRSLEDKAGGLVGYTENNVTISETDIKGKLTVQGKNQVGGFVGQLAGNATIQKSHILNATIISNEAEAGGIIGVTGTSATLINITTDSLSVAGKSGAGGLIAKAEGTVTITCAQVIGKNAVIFAEQDAGGLIGRYSSQLDVSDSAVSAFVESSEGNAGGLIGTMPGTTATLIEKSYYGGRTVSGAYGTYTFDAGTENAKVYEANISGGSNAGGLIGSIGDNPNLNVNYCYSTGSVKTKNGSVGGFIGSIGHINPNGNNISLDHCYSMGKVSSESNDSGTQKMGGFIGQISQAEPNCTSVFYLNAFNLSSLNPVGNSKNSKITKITNASEILGMAESSDLTSIKDTTNYDETLDYQAYPYKNWTTDWEVEGNPITYYGDWPSVSLDGKFMYFKLTKRDNDYSAEAEFTCYDGYKFIGQMSRSNVKIESNGFGLITTLTDRNDVNNVFSISTDGEHYYPFTAEGNNDDPMEGAILHYWGRDYYVYRFTNLKLDKLENGKSVYIKNSLGNIYRITSADEKVKFEKVS